MSQFEWLRLIIPFKDVSPSGLVRTRRMCSSDYYKFVLGGLTGGMQVLGMRLVCVLVDCRQFLRLPANTLSSIWSTGIMTSPRCKPSLG